jgi:hypothetical protein
MLALVMFAHVRALLVSQHRLALEVVPLRQKLAVFERNRAVPNCAGSIDCFWIALALSVAWLDRIPDTGKAGERSVLASRRLFPVPVEFAEAAVAVAVGMLLAEFLPEQFERQVAVLFQLLLDG